MLPKARIYFYNQEDGAEMRTLRGLAILGPMKQRGASKFSKDNMKNRNTMN